MENDPIPAPAPGDVLQFLKICGKLKQTVGSPPAEGTHSECDILPMLTCTARWMVGADWMGTTRSRGL